VETHDVRPDLLDANGHQEVAEIRVLYAVHHCWAYCVGYFQHHFVAGNRIDSFNKEAGVKGNGDLVTVVVSIDIVFNVTRVVTLCTNLDTAVLHGETH